MGFVYIYIHDVFHKSTEGAHYDDDDSRSMRIVANKKKKTRRSKIITIIIIIVIRRRRNRFVRERRFGGFVEKTMWHNDGCEKGKIIAGWRRCMVVGYHEAATASLTQFLRPAGAGSLRAILYTTTSHY